jgi:hypothetical protein
MKKIFWTCSMRCSSSCPPLRERKEDIPLLINHFLYNDSPAAKTRIYGITPAALNILLQYHWPGNLIQLQNVIERAFAMGVENAIGPDDCRRKFAPSVPSPKWAEDRSVFAPHHYGRHLLIQPPIADFYLTAKRTIPYGLASIAAAVQKGFFGGHPGCHGHRQVTDHPPAGNHGDLEPFYGRATGAPLPCFIIFATTATASSISAAR